MPGPARCSVCAIEFELCFRYQLEERPAEQGGARHFCSQRCLEASHTEQADGKVPCDACATAFTVELASQVVFTGGRRHYACRPECRARVLEGVRAVRLGQLLDPRYLPEDSLVTPDPAQASNTRTPPPISGVMEKPRAHGHRPGQAPRAIAVFNQKGGTAKTTTAVHLAAGLARAGRRVLLVDTDGQGNAGASLGITTERTLYHVLVMGLPFRDAVVTARPGLDLLPANETLAAAELYLSGQRNRDRVLASRLEGALDSYEFVVLDCSPSLSLMNQNALVVADAVLCPVACDYLSLLGVRQVVRTIKQVNRLLGHRLNLFGVLPTLFDARARLCRESLDTLKETFQEACLEPIHYAIKAKEAPSQGKTLFEYSPASPTTQDYTRLVERVLGQEISMAAGGTA